jgi:tryptophanyl-tRNA synthetase
MEILNPWEVKGDIDYQRLLSEFGLSPLEKLPKDFNEFLLFRRKIIFAHRDFGKILAGVHEGKPLVMMTGLMPTGKMHIGHMLVAQQMIFYQSLGAKLYICVADIEAYNARGQSLKESREKAIHDYLLNYIALGLKPENVEFYFQSERSKTAEKANAYYRLQNVLARHATFSEFKAVYGEISPGKMLSALLQAADMLHPMLPEFEGKVPVIVPVGVDQDPHMRLARDLAKRVKEFSLLPQASTYHVFMPGLSGGKMSSSDESSFIALTDSSKVVAKKINKYAFSGGRATIEEHRAKGGNPDVDVAFQYLRFWFEPNDTVLADIHARYKSGELLSGELKKLAIERIGAFLDDLEKKREKAKKQLSKFVV